MGTGDAKPSDRRGRLLSRWGLRLSDGLLDRKGLVSVAFDVERCAGGYSIHERPTACGPRLLPSELYTGAEAELDVTR